MNSECPLQKLKWNSFCSFQWRKDKERRIFVILLLKRRHLMYVNVFWFCRYNFLPMTDVSMQKWNNSLLLRVTSGLSIHYFERTVGFFTQNYNQDLLSPVFRRACLIDLVIGAKFQGFCGFLLFENLIFFLISWEAFFLNLIETSFIERVIFPSNVSYP